MVAVALLAGAGCKNDTVQPPPAGSITVTTDKAQYAPGERVLVTVANDAAEPTWLFLYACLPSYEKQQPSGWVPEVIAVCPAGWSYRQLDPGASVELESHASTGGLYRVLVYTLDSPDWSPNPAVHRSPIFRVD